VARPDKIKRGRPEMIAQILQSDSCSVAYLKPIKCLRMGATRGPTVRTIRDERRQSITARAELARERWDPQMQPKTRPFCVKPHGPMILQGKNFVLDHVET